MIGTICLSSFKIGLFFGHSTKSTKHWLIIKLFSYTCHLDFVMSNNLRTILVNEVFQKIVLSKSIFNKSCSTVEIVILKGLYPIGKSWQTVKVKELGHLNNFSPARSYVYIYAWFRARLASVSREQVRVQRSLQLYWISTIVCLHLAY